MEECHPLSTAFIFLYYEMHNALSFRLILTRPGLTLASLLPLKIVGLDHMRGNELLSTVGTGLKLSFQMQF